jgi:hypothetical protein
MAQGWCTWNFTAGQKVFHLTVYYHFHKKPAIGPSERQLNSGHCAISCMTKVILLSLLRSYFTWSVYARSFPTKILCGFLISPMRPTYSSHVCSNFVDIRISFVITPYVILRDSYVWLWGRYYNFRWPAVMHNGKAESRGDVGLVWKWKCTRQEERSRQSQHAQPALSLLLSTSPP